MSNFNKRWVTAILPAAAMFLVLTTPFLGAQEEQYDEKGINPDAARSSDKPVLVSITVTPKPLDRNDSNKIRFKITFQDEGRNLQGGKLEMQVRDDDGSLPDITIDLNRKKYSRRKGKDTIRTTLSIGNTAWIKFKARLRDADGLLSKSRTIKVAVSQGYAGPFGTQVGDRAVDFTLMDQNGNAVSLHDYWGSVILVDFSPQWCPYCRLESADAEQLYQTYKNAGFIILTVLIADYNNNQISQAGCRAWADTYGLTFPVLADVDRSAWNIYNDIGYVPLNIIIDRKMVIRHKFVGYDKEYLESSVAELVAEAPEVFIDGR
ncbi:MAG TPA: TlpA disulfide reductase family protein [Acidobacteriota bacterium]|nr:TlpA disulfide reductase family protein [Acidobacteriota bacterium]